MNGAYTRSWMWDLLEASLGKSLRRAMQKSLHRSRDKWPKKRVAVHQSRIAVAAEILPQYNLLHLQQIPQLPSS